MDVPPPVIVHSNWRTGGTALVSALRQQAGICLFFDPLNPALSQAWAEVAKFGPSDWPSGHPEDMGPYFAEYAPLISQGHVAEASDEFFWRYVLRENDEAEDLARYLASLLRLAVESGSQAVLKTEQMEGRVAWLRATVPAGIHIGLVRDPDAQFASWIHQLSLEGNDLFFRRAHRLVMENPRFFRQREPLPEFDAADWDLLERIFAVFHSATDSVRRNETDVVLDVSPESRQSHAEQREALRAALGDRAGQWTTALAVARAKAPPRLGGVPPRGELRRLHEAGAIWQLRAAALKNEAQRARAEGSAISEERDRLQAENVSLAASIGELHAMVGRLQADRDRGRRHAQVLADERARLAEAMVTMLDSRSWRITRPMRATAEWLGRRRSTRR